jgi:hypothetical protein
MDSQHCLLVTDDILVVKVNLGFFASFRIWIRIDLALQVVIRILIRNADPDQEQGNCPKFTNHPDFQPFKMAYVPTVSMYALRHYYLHKVPVFFMSKSNFL